jgi:uncharacterized surface protein with fasciclin (FAS1) repeats
MKNVRSLVVAGTLSLLVPFSAVAYDGRSSAVAEPDKPKTVLEAAQESGGFTIFLAAVDEADMTKALSSPRMTYTLYAPTDAAFAKLPKEVVVALFEDKDELRRFVAQHVVVGKHASDDIAVGTKRSIWGEPIVVTTHRNIHVNHVKVIATDLESSNGIVHAVDNVMVPSGEIPSGFTQLLAETNKDALGSGNRF